MSGGLLVGLPQRARTPIEVRKAERELFFWTARQTVKLVVLAAVAAYLVVSLAQGRIPGGELLLRVL
ncbi:MAG: hypothetical protein ACLPUT_03455 [Solirubrobacteraceae bacterium]|jgi:hypothetical protein